MALIEHINQLKAQGLSESQIIKTLQEEKFSPVQIQEGLSQSKIKAIVAGSPELNQANFGQEEMLPSIMQQQQEEAQPKQMMEIPTPLTQPQIQYQQTQQIGDYYPAETSETGTEYPQQEMYSEQQAYPEQYEQYPNQEQYPVDEQGNVYAQEPYYQQAIDPEMMRDIANQVMETELEKIKMQMTDLSKLKTELKLQIQDVDTRLEKIEGAIQEIKSSIIKKVEGYGSAMNDISEELRATQESFSKLINPIIDQKRGKPQKEISIADSALAKTDKTIAKRKSSPTPRDSGNSGASFEDYFR